jgi:hypothetical protein
MADGAHPMRSDSDVPKDPRGLEHAFASTAVDSEAAGLRTAETRGRTNWPMQGNATEPWPRARSQMRTRTPETKPGPPRAATANQLSIEAKADFEGASPRVAVQELFKLLLNVVEVLYNYKLYSTSLGLQARLRLPASWAEPGSLQSPP